MADFQTNLKEGTCMENLQAGAWQTSRQTCKKVHAWQAYRQTYKQVHGKFLDKPLRFDMANLLYKQTYKQVLSKLLGKPLRCDMASLQTNLAAGASQTPACKSLHLFTPAWHLMGIWTCNLYSCAVKLLSGVIVISLAEVDFGQLKVWKL
jgi:hypothetical protein